MSAGLYLSYLWDKRHGPYEWEKKLGTHGISHYKNRKYGMLVLAIIIFIGATIFAVVWLLNFFGS
jgi:hypothetical protein